MMTKLAAGWFVALFLITSSFSLGIPLEIIQSDGTKTWALFEPAESEGASSRFIFTDEVGNLDDKRAPMVLDPRDASDLMALMDRFADKAKSYSVKRTSEGYSRAYPMEVMLTLTSDNRVVRYDEDPLTTQKLLPEFRAQRPLRAQVKYGFEDVERTDIPGTNRIDPNGKLVVRDGEVRVAKLTKPISVHEGLPNNPDKPACAGDMPSVAEALTLAKRGLLTKMRFVADFGPQYPGGAAQGTPHRARLIPLVPLALVQNAKGTKLVACLPPDRLKDFQEGKIKPEELIVLDARILRYLPDVGDWKRVNDDYLALRASGKSMEQCCVGRVVKEEEAKAKESPLNTVDNSDFVLASQLKKVREQTPEALFDGRPGFAGGGGGCGGVPDAMAH